MNDEDAEENKTLVEVFEFDELSPEQRREHLRQAALALGLDKQEQETP